MKNTSKITSFLTLSVFAVFAICVLAVLVSGVKVYAGVVRRGSDQHTRRVAAQYVTTRIRQAEEIAVEDFGGCEALVLRDVVEGDAYLTRVYCYDGMLRELFCAESAKLGPEAGETLTELGSLSAQLENGLLTVRLDSQKLVFRVPDGKEMGP